MRNILYMVVFTLLSNETVENNINDTLFYIPKLETLTNAEARATCEKLGSKWGLPDYQTYGTNLTDYMKKENIPSIWLALEKKFFGRWMWLNSSASISKKKIVEDPGYMCGGIAVQGMRLQSMSCSESGNGFVCEMPGGEMCPEKIHTQNCIEYENTWYMIACNSKNWYHAKTYCIRRGGQLAILDTVQKRFAILNVIVERSLFQQCGWLYIGLRQEDWWIKHRTDNTDIVPRFFHWAYEQPKFGKQECSILREDSFWYSKGCRENLNVICQNYAKRKSDIKHLYYIKQNDKQNKNSTSKNIDIDHILVIILLSATFISIPVTCIAVWPTVRWYSKKPIDYGTIYPDLLLPLENAFTVVIFSSPLDDWFVRKVTSVKHIEWPFVQKHKSSTGTSMAAALYTYLNKLGIEKLTRCVCIDALDTNGELPEETAKEILKYLCNNIREFERLKQTYKTAYKRDSIIDIVLLPKFKVDSPDPVEILESIYFLRKHVILMSHASPLPALPSTEVISVGGATELHQPAFSVVDFVVKSKSKEWDTEESAQFLSLAVVSAIAIAILNCFLQHNPRSNLQTLPLTIFIHHALVAQLRHHKATSSEAYDEFICLEVSELFPSAKDKDTSKLNLHVLTLDKDFITSALDTFKNRNKLPFPAKNLPRNATFDTDQLGKHNAVIQLCICHELEYNIGPYKGWNVENTAETSSTKKRESVENSVNEQFKVLIDTLLHSKLSTETLRNHVKIRHMKMSEIGKDADTAAHTQHKLENYQVIAIMFPLPDDRLKDILLPLQNLASNCVVITPCLATKRPPLPVDFPGNLIISPGAQQREDKYESMVTLEGTALYKKASVKWQSCGSSLDFICQWWSKEYTLDDPWEATSFTTAIITIILLKARSLGLEEAVIKRLHTTKVMQRVLRFMCSNYSKHEMFEGWGILQPWKILDEPNDLLQLIHDCTANADDNYWNGRNI